MAQIDVAAIACNGGIDAAVAQLGKAHRDVGYLAGRLRSATWYVKPLALQIDYAPETGKINRIYVSQLFAIGLTAADLRRLAHLDQKAKAYSVQEMDWGLPEEKGCGGLLVTPTPRLDDQRHAAP